MGLMGGHYGPIMGGYYGPPEWRAVVVATDSRSGVCSPGWLATYNRVPGSDVKKPPIAESVAQPDLFGT